MSLHFGLLLRDLLALHLEAGVLRLQEVVFLLDALARLNCVYHAEACAARAVVVARSSLHFELLLLLLLRPFLFRQTNTLEQNQKSDVHCHRSM